jgi:repressor LexA
MVELNLTKRQQEIFDYVKRHVGEHGYPPTVRDIGKAIGLTSSSTVHAHLGNLERLGLLRRDPTKPRAIEVLVDKARQSVKPVGLPVVGAVAAGAPVLAEENIEEYVQVPAIAGGEEGEYVLRVAGESMRDAGIMEGDFVVVRPQDSAKDGDIVVALVGEEATVKRFFKEKDHIRLQPENSSMEPIRSSDVRVLGRVVGVFRNIT